MLETEIAIVERGSDVCIPGAVCDAWRRIKTALAELGTTPNTASAPCKCVVKQTEVPGMGIIYSQRECPIHGHLHSAHC